MCVHRARVHVRVHVRVYMCVCVCNFPPERLLPCIVGLENGEGVVFSLPGLEHHHFGGWTAWPWSPPVCSLRRSRPVCTPCRFSVGAVPSLPQMGARMPSRVQTPPVCPVGTPLSFVQCCWLPAFLIMWISCPHPDDAGEFLGVTTSPVSGENRSLPAVKNNCLSQRVARSVAFCTTRHEGQQLQAERF